MKFFKLLSYDIRNTIFRSKFLLAPIILLLPCLACYQTIGNTRHASTADYIMFCFMGAASRNITGNQPDVQLPIFWILLMGSCLVLNLDHINKDLTHAGQQLLVRSGKRQAWYTAKYISNILNCLLFFASSLLLITMFSYIVGCKIEMKNSPDVTLLLFSSIISIPVSMSTKQVIMCTVISPLCTFIALSVLEMTLCLFVKPTLSFTICVLDLILAIYWNTPLIIGNGAMVARSEYLVADGISHIHSIIVAEAITLLCFLVGAFRVKQTDILSLDI